MASTTASSKGAYRPLPELEAGGEHPAAAAAAAQPQEPPKDPYRLTYVLFCYLGIAQLLPWNAFINANPYFATRVVGSIFADNFKNYFSLGFMGSNVAFLALALKYGQKYSLALRMSVALAINAVVFLMATVLTRLADVAAYEYFYATFTSVILAGASTAFFQNSLFGLASEFPPIYTQAVMTGQAIAGFVVSLAQILAVLASGADDGEPDPIACGIENATSLAGLAAASLAPRTSAFVSVASTVVAARLGAGAAADDDDEQEAEDAAIAMSAFVYFLISFLIIAGGALCFVVLRKLPLYYHHHRLPKLLRRSEAQYRPLNNGDDEEDDSSNTGNGDESDSAVSFVTATAKASEILDRPLQPISNLYFVFSLIRVPALTVGLNFFITLALFPAITGSVQPLDRCSSGANKYYLAIFNSLHFLVFNLGDLIGRTATGYPMLSGVLIRRPRLLTLLTVARIGFLPLFMVSNVVLFDQTGAPLPSSIPSILANDALFFLLMLLFSTTNGFFGSLLMMTGPEPVPGPSKETAGSMMVFFLTTGLSLGSLSSFALRGMLCGCNPFTG